MSLSEGVIVDFSKGESMKLGKLVLTAFLFVSCDAVRLCLAQTPDGVFIVGSDVSAPVALYKVDLEYSEEARKAQYSGTVVLQAVGRCYRHGAGHPRGAQPRPRLG